MEIITGTSNFEMNIDTAVAIGKFDGVHIGHRRLLEEILAKKAEGLAPCVFTFDPSPAKVFGIDEGAELTSREEKRELLERCGVEILVEYPLTRELAAMEPEDFVRDVLVGGLSARFVAAGKDVSYGNKGRGDGRLLLKLSKELGFSVSLIDKVCIDGIEVSSTAIRECIERGDINMAERMLGRKP